MTTSSHRYVAFGLVIDSDLEMPELNAHQGEGDADVLIRRRPVATVTGVEESQTFETALFKFGAQEHFFSWEAVGNFAVRGGREIDYWPREDVSEALISLPLLGAVMSVLLMERQMLTLHGSAIELRNGVAIFLGDKGAGKSTTAAVLVQSGRQLLTDDVVAISWSDGPVLHPSYPQVKLTREADAALTLDAQSMVSPHPEFDKARLLIEAPFNPGDRRPTAAFILARGDDFRIEPLSGADALQALIRFSYATRFGSELIRGKEAVTHLRQCARLSQDIHVARLIVPNDLSRLQTLPEWLEQALADLDHGAAA